MKKFVAFAMILALLSTAFIGSAVLPASAEEGITEAPFSVIPSGEPSVGVWMNNPQGLWFRMTFNAAASFKNLTCFIHAGEREKNQQAIVNYKLYSWYYNKEATLAREPVASGNFTAISNAWHTIDFDTMPAGQYIFELMQAPPEEQSGPATYSVVALSDPIDGVDVSCEWSKEATVQTAGKPVMCGKIGFLTNESGAYYNALLQDAPVPTSAPEDTTSSPTTVPSTSTTAPSTSGGEGEVPPTGDSNIAVIICLVLLSMFAIAGSRIIIKRRASK